MKAGTYRSITGGYVIIAADGTRTAIPNWPRKWIQNYIAHGWDLAVCIETWRKLEKQ